MLGKPIALVAREDLDRLIRDGIPEGRHLEYKEAVPVSSEQQKAQAKAEGSGGAKAVDKSVAAGTGIGEYGRNKLLEELVAFANADGGVIVLGMSETENAPPRAKSIKPIPHVLALEQRLSDQIIDQIEPRLPYASVRAITLEDGKSGVLLLETQGSVLGPHWVKSNRSATIRREDKCVPLSMPELHEIVLRNARRFDDVRQRLNSAHISFADRFVSAGYELTQPGIKKPLDLEQWFGPTIEKRLLGLRATVVPHQSLGLSRLESLRKLVSYVSIDEIDEEGKKFNGISLLFPEALVERPRLGGVESKRNGGNFLSLLRADRDGGVEVWGVWLRDAHERLAVSWFLSFVGSALAIYDNLRRNGGRSILPAEIQAEIRTVKDLATQLGDGYPGVVGENLNGITLFDPVTIADTDNFNACINALAGDFANAIGLNASLLPRYQLSVLPK